MTTAAAERDGAESGIGISQVAGGTAAEGSCKWRDYNEMSYLIKGVVLSGHF